RLSARPRTPCPACDTAATCSGATRSSGPSRPAPPSSRLILVSARTNRANPGAKPCVSEDKWDLGVASWPSAGRRLGLVGAGGPGPGADTYRVPGVDDHDEADQGRDLVRAVNGGHLLVGLRGHVGLGQQRHRLGEGERGALTGGEERGLPPGGQRVD